MTISLLTYFLRKSLHKKGQTFLFHYFSTVCTAHETLNNYIKSFDILVLAFLFQKCVRMMCVALLV